MDEKALERFWGYVHADPNGGCWLFAGAGVYGYGGFWFTKQWRAHRLAYSHFVGPIPEGMHVLHKCDVRCCVNPDHLWIGTNGDNMRDKEAKGRANHAVGVRCHNARLSPRAVRHIRSSDETPCDLANRYGVTTTAIYNVLKRKTWRHV